MRCAWSGHDYAPPQIHITANKTLVQMDVVVRDSRGHVVSGLKQGDFEILDEGKPRAITAFSEATRMPVGSGAAVPQVAASTEGSAAPALRSTLLFFDDLHITSAELQRMQAAAVRFVRNGIGLGNARGCLRLIGRARPRLHGGSGGAHRLDSETAVASAHFRGRIAAVPADHSLHRVLDRRTERLCCVQRRGAGDAGLQRQ